MITYSKKQSRSRLLLSSLVLVLTFILSGCTPEDGSSSNPDSTPTQVPTQAPTQVPTQAPTQVPTQVPTHVPSSNHQPTVGIKVPESAISGQTVTLDGSSFDSDGDTLSYQWTQTDGPDIAFSNTTGSSLVFVAPTVAQVTELTFILSVSDGELSSSAVVSVQITPILDTTSPSVISRSPEQNQSGVSPTVEIRVSFDEALLASSVNSQSLVVSQNGTVVAGIVSYDSTSHSITNKPISALSASATYTVTLANTLKDSAGNAFGGYSWNFQTSDAATNTDTVGKRKFDFVIGVDGDFKAARIAASKSGGERFRIFFPNGEYDIGALLMDSDENQTTDFQSGNVSFIGQDNVKTVIYNTATVEGLATSPTLRLHGDNLYFQDVALQNRAKVGTGRFTVIDERGKHTIYKNVRMLSGQDTYYTKGDKTYWEGGEIHGTTDFICGGGDIFFHEVLLWSMKKSAISAPASHENKWGHVFNHCTIDGTEDGYYYGRNWNGGAAIFLNTVMKKVVNNAGWANGISDRTNQILLAEYNSRKSDGSLVDTSKRASQATVLSESEAAKYTIENVLGGWDPRKDTKQVTAPLVRQEGTSLTWNNAPDALNWVLFRNGKYLDNVTTNSYDISSIGSGDTITIRAANAMGGLGAVSNSVTISDSNSTGNHRPIAKIGSVTQKIPGETVTLDGRGSSDVDGDILSYLWTQTQGNIITLTDNSNQSLTFVAPRVTQPTQYTFKLTVNDGELSGDASVTVLVSPVSSAGLCNTAAEGNSLTLNCPSGQVINEVTFASYGTPGGSCGSFTTGSCNASNSVSVVSEACKGKNNCTVYAGNDSFGDPCSGMVKKLTAQVACGNATDSSPAPDPGPNPDTGADGNRLTQNGNPIHARFDKYKDYIDKVDNVLSYQLNCGGWPKNQSYDKPGNGGNDKGTFDNGATTMEMTLMADAYRRTGDTRYMQSARKAMDYIFEAQYPEGGWPQFYPLRGGYSDHVTFNDDAMSRILTLLQKALDRVYPFDTDVLTDAQRSKLQRAIDGGVDYILKAQYVQNGKKTVWCAQHGKSDYQPKQARSYEWPSLSGSESVEIIGFLMFVPQTPEIKQAVINAVNWFNSPDTYLQDYAYENDNFVQRKGSRVWARFHDLETNLPVFSTYDAPMYVGLEYQDKKKPGYRWGGTWGEKIISYAKSVGYIN